MTKLKRPKKWMTGDEHDAWLKETGQYDAVIETQRKYDEELEKRWAARNAALVPLKEDLHAAGCSLSDAGYLSDQPNIPTAVPILFAHLQRTTYPLNARVHIASLLNLPEVKPHWDLLLQLYGDEHQERVRNELASVILTATDYGKDNSKLDQVIAFIRDKRNGGSRVLLLYLLEKTKDPRGRATMEELADDPDLAIQIPISLKRMDRRKLKQAERQARKKHTRH